MATTSTPPPPQDLGYDVEALVLRVLSLERETAAACWDWIETICGAAVRLRRQPVRLPLPFRDPRPEALVSWLAWAATGAILLRMPIAPVAREVLGEDVIALARRRIGQWRQTGAGA